MRQITIDEALKEVKKRLTSTMKDLDSLVWRANHGNLYSYTLGRQDALDEVITLLEASYL